MGNAQVQTGREKTVEEFMKELGVNGRYFVGSPQRQSYIASHRAEINSYLDSLGAMNASEADRLNSLVVLNSKSQSRKQISLDELVETRGRILSKSSIPKKRIITPYSSKPRIRIQGIISSFFVLGLGVALGYFAYRANETLKKIVNPYAQRFYQIYYEIDHRR